MRMLLRAQPDITLANQAIQDGTLAKVLEEVSQIVNPEAFYVGPDGGTRTLFMVFELTDPAQIVQVTEPFYQKLNAKVELVPVMNREELGAGLAATANA